MPFKPTVCEPQKTHKKAHHICSILLQRQGDGMFVFQRGPKQLAWRECCLKWFQEEEIRSWEFGWVYTRKRPNSVQTNINNLGSANHKQPLLRTSAACTSCLFVHRGSWLFMEYPQKLRSQSWSVSDPESVQGWIWSPHFCKVCLFKNTVNLNLNLNCWKKYLNMYELVILCSLQPKYPMAFKKKNLTVFTENLLNFLWYSYFYYFMVLIPL